MNQLLVKHWSLSYFLGTEFAVLILVLCSFVLLYALYESLCKDS